MNIAVSELCNRARQFAQWGQFDTAAKIYEQIIALEPGDAPAYFEAGVFSLRQERPELAIERLSKAIELDPNRTEFHNILGVALVTSGDQDGGARCFQKAIDLDPGNAVAHSNLASSHRERGSWEDAIGCYRKAISADPQYLDAYVHLAGLLSRRGDLASAANVYRQAISLNANDQEIKIDLAVTLNKMALFEESVAVLTEVVTEHSENTRALNSLGLALVTLGRFDEAIANYHRAMELNPGYAAVHNNLGLALKLKSDVAGAIASFREVLAIEPGHAVAHSNLLLAMNYLPEISQEQRYQEALQFEGRHAHHLSPTRPDFPNSRETERAIRIGYVSPDFRSHSVAHFTRKLIEAHDRDNIEVFCYSNVVRQDAFTQEFKAHADHWLSIVGMTDEQAAHRIREDQIDILIDLAGHTAANRLLMFAHRPAPIQVNWLGYPNTTGLTSIDYRLTDSIADPPGAADRLHTEKLVRLPDGFLCYQNDDPQPPVSMSPYLTNGYVTFGSFNNLAKVTSDVIRVWSAILKRIPNARLILKSWALGDRNTRTQIHDMFLDQGITPERIDLLGRVASREEHLRMYSKIDICLDTFPYNGTTTTCEALWMGAPVVTLRGEHHAGRVGATIMHHTGLPDVTAESEDAYVDLACTLAGDTQRLLRLRESLRPQLRRSKLMNIQLFTKMLEEAYRDIWITWCNSNQ